MFCSTCQHMGGNLPCGMQKDCGEPSDTMTMEQFLGLALRGALPPAPRRTDSADAAQNREQAAQAR